jgi:hypothetical protein
MAYDLTDLELFLQVGSITQGAERASGVITRPVTLADNRCELSCETASAV